AVLRDDGGREYEVQMAHRWPVRIPRPFEKKLLPEVPLITGQRVLDFFFPIALGGNAAIPGGFGTGKTVTEQTLAKFAHVDIVIYIGCGERGNEMTEVLAEFPELEDPTRPGAPLMDRTILVVNTSNMPVAAREASIYTGITMAEYYRDMGYDVLLLADSTSRWAEALREMSSRLEEMPGEEGYPTYLSSKLAAFYERTGRVYPLGGRDQIGSVTAVGAVSPQGGDFSEPVTQSTLRVVGAFWALDSDLARRRHYPAINWLTSYTLYYGLVKKWFHENVDEAWTEMRNWASEMLQRDAELTEIVQLVGPDALEDAERVLLETGALIREAFLQQNAFHEVDGSSSLQKDLMILRVIRFFSELAMDAVKAGRFHAEDLHALPEIEEIERLKELRDEEVRAKIEEIMASLKEKLG
ncbi:MAG: V-type ATP synthase subunit A, partial [candidate division WOR-3 bacterium]